MTKNEQDQYSRKLDSQKMYPFIKVDYGQMKLKEKTKANKKTNNICNTQPFASHKRNEFKVHSSKKYHYKAQMQMPSFYELVVKSSTRLIPEVWKTKIIFNASVSTKKKTKELHIPSKYLKII